MDNIRAEEYCCVCLTQLDNRFARYRLNTQKVICVPCKLKEVQINKVEPNEPS